MCLCKFIILSIFVFSSIELSCAWFKSNFTINSKLPRECGHVKNYNPENGFEPWGTWPWMGLLIYDGVGSHRCNSILIHPQAAISSMICFRRVNEDLKDHTFIAFSLPGLPSFQNVSVTDIDTPVEKYNSPVLALMKLERAVIISSFVQPICLWEAHQDWDSQISSHVGVMIGSDLNNIYEINQLRIYQAPVKIVPNKKCKVLNDVYFKSSGYGICFNYIRNPHDCHSVSSPLMFPRLNEGGNVVWYMRAMLVYVMWFCDSSEYYNHLLDIGAQRNWIDSHFKSSVEVSCGRRVVSHTALIVKGVNTIRGDWPWHVAIYVKTDNSYICGGSLISQLYILTAAHCTVNKGRIRRANTLSVLLGKYALDLNEPDSKRIDISEVIVHEQFDPSTLLNDIALLKLKEGVTYSEYIQPGCLWDETNTNKENIFNRVGTVAGWGFTEDLKISNELKSASVPIIEDVICYQMNANFYDKFLHDSSFCAGNPRGNGTNVCNGDSGGSLVLPIIQEDGEVTWYIRGLVSIAVARVGDRSCDPDYPVVYTDVAQYIKWISTHML